MADGASSSRRQSVGDSPTVFPSRGTGGALSIGAATALVGDSALSAAAVSPLAVGATVLETVLATVTSANNATSAVGLEATIDWGDGSGIGSGDVVGGGGSFAVLGSHVYALGGNYLVGITVRDALGRVTSTATRVAVDVGVVEPAVQLRARPVSTIEGRTETRTAAIILDKTPGRSASDYTATVDPGDGSGPHAATVEGANGVFRVRDPHAYATTGSYSLEVSVQGPGGTLTDQAAVLVGAAPISVTSADVRGEVAVESSNVLLGVLTSTNGLATASTFSVSLDWGDGTQGGATLTTLGGGAFEIRGSHTYAVAGGYAVEIGVEHQAGGLASATGRAEVVAPPEDDPADPDEPTLEASGETLAAVEGEELWVTVATFRAGPDFDAADFAAQIAWGDNTTSAGEVVDGGDGYFSVMGEHVYARGGSFTIAVTIQGPDDLTAAATTAAAVESADWWVEGTESWTVVGVPLQEEWLAFVSDLNTRAAVSDYSVSIAWGDGTQPQSASLQDINGAWVVVASHTYNAFGEFTAAITVTDTTGVSHQTAVAVSVYRDDILAAGNAEAIATRQGAALDSVRLASFTTLDLVRQAGDFTATADWGDGTGAGNAVVEADGAGGFVVRGSHSYAAVGVYEVTVTITGPTGTRSTAHSFVRVDRPVDTPVTLSPAPLNLQEDQLFEGGLATFTDDNEFLPPYDPTNTKTTGYTARVEWGDGSLVEDVAVVRTGQNSFAIRGKHRYEEPGSYTAKIYLRDDDDDSEASAYTAASFTVTDLGAFTLQAESLALAAEGELVRNATESNLVDNSQDAATRRVTPDLVRLATFSDPDLDRLAGDYEAKVTWSSGGAEEDALVTRAREGHFVVWGTHAYDDSGTYQVTLTVTDTTSNTPRSVTTQATVGATVSQAFTHPSTANAPAGQLRTLPGTELNGVVLATLWDANPFEQISQYQAVTINWGDGGGTSAGTVYSAFATQPAVPATAFEIRGSHTYTQAGSYAVTVTFKEKADGQPVTATLQIVVDDPTKHNSTALAGTLTSFNTAMAGVLRQQATAHAQKAAELFRAQSEQAQAVLDATRVLVDQQWTQEDLLNDAVAEANETANAALRPADDAFQSVIDAGGNSYTDASLAARAAEAQTRLLALDNAENARLAAERTHQEQTAQARATWQAALVTAQAARDQAAAAATAGADAARGAASAAYDAALAAADDAWSNAQDTAGATREAAGAAAAAAYEAAMTAAAQQWNAATGAAAQARETALAGAGTTRQQALAQGSYDAAVGAAHAAQAQSIQAAWQAYDQAVADAGADYAAVTPDQVQTGPFDLQSDSAFVQARSAALAALQAALAAADAGVNAALLAAQSLREAAVQDARIAYDAAVTAADLAYMGALVAAHQSHEAAEAQIRTTADAALAAADAAYDSAAAAEAAHDGAGAAAEAAYQAARDAAHAAHTQAKETALSTLSQAASAAEAAYQQVAGTLDTPGTADAAWNGAEQSARGTLNDVLESAQLTHNDAVAAAKDAYEQAAAATQQAYQDALGTPLDGVRQQAADDAADQTNLARQSYRQAREQAEVTYKTTLAGLETARRAAYDVAQSKRQQELRNAATGLARVRQNWYSFPSTEELNVAKKLHEVQVATAERDYTSVLRKADDDYLSGVQTATGVKAVALTEAFLTWQQAEAAADEQKQTAVAEGKAEREVDRGRAQAILEQQLTQARRAADTAIAQARLSLAEAAAAATRAYNEAVAADNRTWGEAMADAAKEHGEAMAAATLAGAQGLAAADRSLALGEASARQQRDAALASADAAYNQALAAADAAWQHATADAYRTQAEGLADADAAHAEDLATAGQTRVQELAEAARGRAEADARAAEDYAAAAAQAEHAAALARAAAAATAQTAVSQAEADAYAGWATGQGTAYAALLGAKAAACHDLNAALAQSGTDLAADLADALQAFRQQSAAAEADFTVDVAEADLAHGEALEQAAADRAGDEAEALRQNRYATAAADHAESEARTQADAQWSAAETGAAAANSAAVVAADYAEAQALAEASYSHAHANAAATNARSLSVAGSEHARDVAVVELEDARDQTLAAARETLDVALAQAVQQRDTTLADAAVTRAGAHAGATPARTTAQAEALRDFTTAVAAAATAWVAALATASGDEGEAKANVERAVNRADRDAATGIVLAYQNYVLGKRTAGNPELFSGVPTGDWFVDGVQSIRERFNRASSEAAQGWTAGLELLERAADVVVEVGEQVVQVATDVVNAIVETFAAGVQWTQKTVNGIVQGVIEIGSAVIEATREAAEAFGKKLLEMGKTAAELWDLAQQFGDAAQAVMSAFVNRPEEFLTQVLQGIQQGFQDFFAALSEKLPGVLMEWLGSKMQGLTLPPLPESWTVASTAGFLLKLMRLDWDSVQGMLVNAVGADNVALVMGVLEKVQGLVDGGGAGLSALLEDIEYSADTLYRDALAAGAEALIGPVTEAAVKFVVEKLAMGPGVGALMSLYRGLTWVLDPQTAEQIRGVVGGVVQGVRDVARGVPGADLAASVKGALLGGIPVALNFVIKQVPALEKIPANVTKALTSVSGKVEAKLKDWADRATKALLAGPKLRPGLVGNVHAFTVPGSAETYELWLAKVGGKLTIMLDGIGDAKALDLQADLPATLSAEMKGKVAGAVARVLAEGQNLVNLLAAKPPKVKEARALQSPAGALGKALAELQVALVGAPCERLLSACFAAGTLLRTPGGLQAIEAVRAGDRVLSRDEHDPRGGPDYKVVEEVFERLGSVWHLTAGGRQVRTTGEHPFYDPARGWVPCRALAPGDRLVCEDGTTVAVEEAVDTGAVEVVYNLRVADWHTYFVGGQEWGFSVWAHNTYYDEFVDKSFEKFKKDHSVALVTRGVAEDKLKALFRVWMDSFPNTRASSGSTTNASRAFREHFEELCKSGISSAAWGQVYKVFTDLEKGAEGARKAANLPVVPDTDADKMKAALVGINEYKFGMKGNPRPAYGVEVVGCLQETDAERNHQATVAWLVAERIVRTSTADKAKTKIYMNRDLQEVLRNLGETAIPAVPTEYNGLKTGGPKPDIIIVRPDGKLEIIEVQSITSQNREFMDRTIDNVKNYLRTNFPNRLHENTRWEAATKSVADLYGVPLPVSNK